MPSSITSLALIRSNWDYSRSDYLETFVPLIATLILKRDFKIIEPHHVEDLKKDFTHEYGLLIPYSPIQQILRRLTKRGLLKRNEKNLEPVVDKLQKLDLSRRSASFKGEFEDILANLKLFIAEKTEIAFDFEELENGFTNFLKQNDQAILFAADQNSFLPKVKSSRKLDHLIAEFIAHAHKNDNKLFTFLLNITIGYAITSTILYSEFNAFQGKLKGVNVYFDTTFIFDLLGIDGPFKKKLATDLVKILRKQGVNLFLLQTNFGEVEANLSECLKMMDDGKIDPTKVSNLTFKQCFQNSITNSDLEEIVIGFEDSLKTLEIRPEVVPDFTENKVYQIDENKLYDLIIDIYSSRKAKLVSSGKTQEEENKEIFEKSEKKNNTILRDVKVLSGMYRFRKGKKPATIKDCNAIFVTTNSTLAYASREFEKKEYNTSHTLPVAITDVFLGTLIWLQSPAEIGNLREKKLLMDCLSAMQPSEKLIKKYTEQIELLNKKGVISDDLVYLMRAHRSAYNILESKTLGDPDEVNEQSTREILDELIAQIKSEEAEKYKDINLKLDQVKSERDLAFGEVEVISQKRIADLSERFNEIKGELLSLETRVENLKIRAKAKVRATLKAFLIVWISSIVGLAIVTYFVGWDIMEPISYFIGALIPVGSYLYLFITNKHWSLKDIYQDMIQKKWANLITENEIDMARMDDLRVRKTDMIKEIEELGLK